MMKMNLRSFHYQKIARPAVMVSFLRKFGAPLLIILPVLSWSSIQLDRFLHPRFLSASVISCLILLGIWASKSSQVKLTPVRLFFFGWVCLSLLSGVNSEVTGEYLFGSLRIVSYLFMFLAFSELFIIGGSNKILLYAVTLMASGLSVLGIYQFLQPEVSLILKGLTSVSGLMGHKNLFAEYLAVLMPFVLLSSIRLKGIWKIVSILSAVSMFGLISLVMGRGAWLATAVVIIMSTSLFFVSRTPRVRLKMRLRSLVVMISLGVGLIVITWLLGVTDVYWDRLVSTIDLDSGSVAMRLKVWKLAWESVRENPLLGIGLGDLKIELGAHQLLSYHAAFLTRAHNDLAEILIECGLPALLCFLAMIAMSCYSLISYFVTKECGIAAASLIAIVAFCITSMFSFPIQRIEHTALLCMALGYSDSISHSRILNRFRLPRGYSSMVVIFIVSIAVYIGVVRFRSESFTKDAIEAKSKGDWEKVVESVAEVDLHLYPIDPTTTPVKWYSGLAWFQLGIIDSAFADFVSAYEINPYHAHVLNNLGTCYAQKGRFDDALKMYDDAICFQPSFFDAKRNKVALLVYLGEKKAARHFLELQPKNVRNRLDRIFRDVNSTKNSKK